MIPPRVEVPLGRYEPTARDVMRYAHVTVGPDESLARTHEKMQLFRAEELVVVDGRHVLGVVTSRALHRVRASSRPIAARDVMIRSIVTVTPTVAMREAARLAREHGATHVVVVLAGTAIGAFALEDVEPTRASRPRPARLIRATRIAR